MRVEAEVGDRGEHRARCIGARVEPTHDATLVARVADPRDDVPGLSLARDLWTKCRWLLRSLPMRGRA